MECDQPPPPKNEAYLNHMLRFLDYADDETNVLLSNDIANLETNEELSKQKARRQEAHKRLAHNLAASRIENCRIVDYRHNCPLGCHEQYVEFVAYC